MVARSIHRRLRVRSAALQRRKIQQNSSRSPQRDGEGSEGRDSGREKEASLWSWRTQPRPALRDGSVEAQTIRETCQNDRRLIASILAIRISGRGTRGSWDTVQKGESPEISQRSRRASTMAKEEDAQRIAKNYVRRLARSITVRQAILTGSRATGSYLEDSDVDLIIVSDDFSKMQLPERLRYLQKQWKSKIPLEAFGYTVNEFRSLQRKSSYVKEAVRTGIPLLDARGRLAS